MTQPSKLEQQSPSRAAPPQRLIINADDFGYSAETNAGIVASFQRGLISSTTLMASMPGFEEAVRLTHEHNLHGRVGVHLNLTEGVPLTEPIRQCPRICGDGAFIYKRNGVWFKRDELRAIETELTAQIRRIVDAGIHPTHADGHHHIHVEWQIGAIVIQLARRFGITAMRRSLTSSPNMRFHKSVYKLLYNGRLRWCGLAKTRYFVPPARARAHLGGSGDIEIAFHPYAADGTIRDLDLGADFEDFVTRNFQGIPLASYGAYRTDPAPSIPSSEPVARVKDSPGRARV